MGRVALVLLFIFILLLILFLILLFILLFLFFQVLPRPSKLDGTLVRSDRHPPGFRRPDEHLVSTGHEKLIAVRAAEDNAVALPLGWTLHHPAQPAGRIENLDAHRGARIDSPGCIGGERRDLACRLTSGQTQSVVAFAVDQAAVLVDAKGPQVGP